MFGYDLTYTTIDDAVGSCKELSVLCVSVISCSGQLFFKRVVELYLLIKEQSPVPTIQTHIQTGSLAPG